MDYIEEAREAYAKGVAAQKLHNLEVALAWYAKATAAATIALIGGVS